MSKVFSNVLIIFILAMCFLAKAENHNANAPTSKRFKAETSTINDPYGSNPCGVTRPAGSETGAPQPPVNPPLAEPKITPNTGASVAPKTNPTPPDDPKNTRPSVDDVIYETKIAEGTEETCEQRVLDTKEKMSRNQSAEYFKCEIKVKDKSIAQETNIDWCNKVQILKDGKSARTTIGCAKSLSGLLESIGEKACKKTPMTNGAVLECFNHSSPPSLKD